jgi:hypothetical protein
LPTAGVAVMGSCRLMVARKASHRVRILNIPGINLGHVLAQREHFCGGRGCDHWTTTRSAQRRTIAAPGGGSCGGCRDAPRSTRRAVASIRREHCCQLATADAGSDHPHRCRTAMGEWWHQATPPDRTDVALSECYPDSRCQLGPSRGKVHGSEQLFFDDTGRPSVASGSRAESRRGAEHQTHA